MTHQSARPVLVIAIFLGVVLSGCSVTENRDFGSSSAETRHGMGAIPLDESLAAAKMLQRSVNHLFLSGAALPAAADLSSNLPPVGDQGPQGSCVAWAVAYYLKTYQERVEEKWNINLNSNQFSPSWVYNQINGGVDQGSTMGAGLNLLVNKGCDTLNNFPYNPYNYTQQPGSDSYTRALQYKSSTWNTLPNDIAVIKDYLARGIPLVFQLAVYSDLYYLTPSNPVYNETSGALLGYHALCLVGYDDSKSAFKFVNSWGSGWGTWKNDSDTSQGKGFGWVSYNYVNPGSLISFLSFVLVDTANPHSSSSTSSLVSSVSSLSSAISSSKSSVTSSSSLAVSSSVSSSRSSVISSQVSSSLSSKASSSSNVPPASSTPSQNRIEAESYTTMNNIQKETCVEGGQQVTYAQTGSWTGYTINVPTAGTYNIEFRVSSPVNSGMINLIVGGYPLLTVAVPNTSGYQNFISISTPLNLKAGSQTFYLFANSGGYAVNWFTITPSASQPFGN